MEKKLLHKSEPKIYEQNIRRKYRNYKWLLYVSIIGLSLMFLSLTFMYFLSHANWKQPPFRISLLFYANTFVLLASSMLIIIAQRHFIEDNYRQYKICLNLIFCCGILFLVGQSVGWYKMFMTGNDLKNNSAAYLYVIFGLHALHIIGGLIYLSYFILKSRRTLKEYATSVVYFTDPVAKSQLRLFGIFWHFLGVLWLYLLFFFTVFE
jgi:cytochrome c oxidase subunit 3